MMGCATKYIANTEIEDTEANREIWNRVTEYRKAIEDRNADALLGLVSRQYYSNAGTTDDPTDDYGYNELRDVILEDFRNNLAEVQMRIIMQEIKIDGERAHASFEYYYNFRYLEGGNTAWQPKNDFNQLDFIKENDLWMIISGL